MSVAQSLDVASLERLRKEFNGERCRPAISWFHQTPFRPAIHITRQGLGAMVTGKIVIVEIMIASGGIRHSQLQSPALQCCCLS